MPRKKKSLDIRPDDHVVGMVPRQKVDLFAGCNEAGKPWFQKDDHEFMRIHCAVCKNADCVRAKGSISPWHTRMAEQVDYLLNDPDFSELKTDAHRMLAEMAFEDISQQAMKLEIARVQQDWTIPDSPSDGIDKVADPGTTDQFDDAVRKLAEAKGNKAPALERPASQDAPAHFQPTSEDSSEIPNEGSTALEDYEYDTQYPSSDGSSSYHVTLSKRGRWACSCEGFKHKGQCKHLSTVRAWYEDQLRNTSSSQVPQEQPLPPRPAERKTTPPTSGYNTPMPQGGVMVGSRNSGRKDESLQPAHDPWSPRNEKIVKSGAVVTLKGGKK